MSSPNEMFQQITLEEFEKLDSTVTQPKSSTYSGRTYQYLCTLGNDNENSHNRLEKAAVGLATVVNLFLFGAFWYSNSLPIPDKLVITLAV